MKTALYEHFPVRVLLFNKYLLHTIDCIQLLPFTIRISPLQFPQFYCMRALNLEPRIPQDFPPNKCCFSCNVFVKFSFVLYSDVKRMWHYSGSKIRSDTNIQYLFAYDREQLTHISVIMEDVVENMVNNSQADGYVLFLHFATQVAGLWRVECCVLMWQDRIRYCTFHGTN